MSQTFEAYVAMVEQGAAKRRPARPLPEVVSAALTDPREVVVDARTGLPRQAGASTPEGRFIAAFRTHAERSLFAFARGVMGRGYLTRQLHKPICEFLQTCPPRRKLLLLAREHAKTSLIGHCLPLHILIQPADDNLYAPGLPGSEQRILLAGESLDRAQDSLRVVQSAAETNPTLRALWPGLIWEAPRREAKAWNDSELIFRRRQEYPDPSLRAIGVGGAITGAHPSVLIKDDLATLDAANSPAIMEAVIRWHTASRALINNDFALEFILGCLAADALILMEDGTQKPIADVKVGETVWAPSDDGTYTRRRVEAMIPQGFAKTLTVATSSKTIRATPNHPFLARRQRRLVWVRADELRVGDQVLSIKRIPGTTDPEFAWLRREFCWLYGFLLGDGWIGGDEKRGYVCIAASKDEDLNEKVVRIASEWFPGSQFHLTPFGYYRCDSVGAVHGLRRLGFTGTAKTKRVPAWAFRLAPVFREAMLRGFCAADGTNAGGHEAQSVEISNRELMEDLRHLAMLCGVRTGKLRSRTRMIRAPHSKEPVASTTWGTTFNLDTITRDEVYPVSRHLFVSRDMRQERVVSVTENAIEEPVYDLTVEGTPAFFANGLAVHNTRWAVHDLYSHVMREDPTVQVWKRALIEDGKLVYPKAHLSARWRSHGFDDEKVADLRRTHGTMFPLLYMNEAGDPSLVDFSADDLRAYTVDGTTRSLVFEEDDRDLRLARKLNAPAPLPSADEMTGQRFSEAYDRLAARGDYLRRVRSA